MTWEVPPKGLSTLDREMALFALGQSTRELKREFQDLPEVSGYLKARETTSWTT